MTDPDLALVREEAWRWRRDGMEYREIADRQNVSVSTAHERVQKHIRARAPQATEDERLLEVDRLDRMLNLLSERIDNGIPPEKIIPVQLLVSAARRKLMGLDPPSRYVAVPTPTEHGLTPIIDEAEREADEEEARLRSGVG